MVLLETQTVASTDEGSVDYGYGDEDFAAESYGYEDAEPVPTHHVKLERRSSLKTSGNYQPRRRNSISYTGEIEVQLCDKTIVRRRTSISFTEQNQVKEVEPALSLLDATSKENLWTTAADYENSQKEVQEILGLAQMVGKCPHRLSQMKHILELRGLEPHMNGQTDDSLLSRFSVLDLQECQRMDGMYCDETVSAVYGELAMNSAEKAHQLGLQDYDEVKEEYSRIMMRKATALALNRSSCSRRASM